MVVRQVMENEKLHVSSIQLGEVHVEEDGTDIDYPQLASNLQNHGFELIDDNKSQLINQIKLIVIQRIRNKEDVDSDHFNLSTYIENQLHHDYHSLSHLFSTMEGRTIERYVISQKMEYIKELLIYDELTLSEIAWKLNYSSVQYLSNQFKKEVGMTPTEFRALNKNDRRSLDAI